MKVGVFIRGTKGGLQEIFASDGFPETDRRFIHYDVRQDSISGAAIGKECYGISFSPKGKVFTKYRGMYDSTRSMAVGFLGISLFVPFELRADGEKVVSFLDELMRVYHDKYAPDNKLGTQNEDWEFVNKLLTKYQEFFKNVGRKNELLSSGIKDAAFIYYKDSLLIKYFENLNQSEYNEYRQILLIDEKLKDTDNILLAIKHSEDLTAQIEIENPKYDLIINRGTQGVEVLVNGHNNWDGEKVKRNHPVRIEFKKAYHDTIKIKETTYGELLRIDNGVLTKDENTITINAPVLSPSTKNITIIVQDVNKDLIYKKDGISISCCSKFNGEVKEMNDNDSITFEGKELGERWTLKVFGGERYNDSYEIYIIPKDEGEKKMIELSSKNTVSQKFNRIGNSFTESSNNNNDSTNKITMPPKTGWQKHKKKNHCFYLYLYWISWTSWRNKINFYFFS